MFVPFDILRYHHTPYYKDFKIKYEKKYEASLEEFQAALGKQIYCKIPKNFIAVGTAQTRMKKELEEAYEVLVSTGIQKNTALELVKNNFVDGMTSEELVLACFKNKK